MPLLTDKTAILETLNHHPERASRLWIEEGHERTWEALIQEAKRQGVAFRILPKEAFARKFKGVRSHACLERSDFLYTDGDELSGHVSTLHAPFLAAFDAIFDPQNLGNIMRSAACFSLDGLIIPKDRSCGVTEAVIAVSMGAVEHVKVARVVNLVRYLATLKEQGIFCYGLDEKAEQVLTEVDLKGPLCLVFGSEEGLRRLTRERCDGLARLPSNPAFPSLNVANAFAVSAYEVRRQRSVSSGRTR